MPLFLQGPLGAKLASNFPFMTSMCSLWPHLKNRYLSLRIKREHFGVISELRESLERLHIGAEHQRIN
jgi:hypothetical protein